MDHSARSEAAGGTRATLLILAVLCGLAGLWLERPGVEPARAADGSPCDLVAATDGRANGSGSVRDPLASPNALVERLRRGQTGCLRAGHHWAKRCCGGRREVALRTPGITLRHFPGEQAVVHGRVYVAESADRAKLHGLRLVGDPVARTSVVVNADDVVLRGNNITSRDQSICLNLGNRSYSRADRVRVLGNRIHRCGELPATNLDHGVYLSWARKTLIRGNLIYDNADRGVQLYPDADGTRVVWNLIDGNGQGVLLGSEGRRVPDNNLVRHNLITNSRIRWNVSANWSGDNGRANLASGNCLWASHPNPYYRERGGTGESVAGFRVLENRVAEVLYRDPAEGDYRLQSDSPCGGYGPEGLERRRR